MPVVCTGGSLTEKVSNATYLGLEIEDKLSWSNHLEKICKKVPSGIGITKRVRPYVSVDT